MTRLFIATGLMLFVIMAKSQGQIYRENSGEIIFSFSNVEESGQAIDTKMRFTLFLHLGQNIHHDFSNNFGFYTGYGLRNIGLITKEGNEEIRRRTYSLGIPFALKVGSFKDHLYFYGGAEYELFFHYKQKMFIDGDKIKETAWFSNRTKRFVPSIFTGVQLPGGINLKFKYYLSNFLNPSFRGKDFGEVVDYSGFNKSSLYYLSLSFNFSKADIKKIYTPSKEAARFTSL